jgi:hypothetical protein
VVSSSSYPPGSPEKTGFEEIVKQLWAPIKVPITASKFVDMEGVAHKLPNDKPIWNKPFGKRLVIMDTDTRPMDKEGELLQPGKVAWDKMKHLSAGMMGHYLYGE